MLNRRKFLGGMALSLLANRVGADCVTELCVTDIGIDVDHADPNQVGSIAWALSQAEASGGTVKLGAGTFNIGGAIRVRSGVMLIGSGVATQIVQWDNNSHGIMIDGQDLYVRDLSVRMPEGSSGGYAGIAFGSESAVKWGAAANLKVSGGNLQSWGFIVDQHYNFKFSRLLVESKRPGLPAVNGMLIHNTHNSFNTGDSEYTSIALRIKSGATGLKIISDNTGNHTGVINNNTFTNVQVLGSSSGFEQGFVLENTAMRNTFITCDSENCGVNWHIRGPKNKKNIFINAQSFGGTKLISAPPMSDNTFIGGNII